MGKFDAATAVEPMEYDFTAHGGEAGVIPEPSTGQVDDFFNAMRKMAVEIRAKMKQLEGATKDQAKDSTTSDDITDEQAIDTIASMDDNLTKEYQESLYRALADLCSDEPSEEDIRKLPYRILSAFSAWVGQQLRPEAQRPVTRS